MSHVARRITSLPIVGTVPATPPRVVAALCLAASGYLHAQLYLRGYRAIPGIGPAFLLQASGSLAVGILLLAAAPAILRIAAAGLAGGALVGFALSRTVGIFGFVEHGLNPAPQALLSILTETATLCLLTIPAARGKPRNDENGTFGPSGCPESAVRGVGAGSSGAGDG